MELDAQDIQDLEKYYKINMINKISGLRSPFLVCTESESGVANLAIFNSIHHIGANPPLLGMIFRPLTVERHTYENIKFKGSFSLNLVHTAILQEAHQTSGKYGRDDSEFDFINLTKERFASNDVLCVQESKLQIALSFVEEHKIMANDTIQMIVKIEAIRIADEMVDFNGNVLHELLETTVVSGLDSYYKVQLVDRLDRVKV